MYGDKNTACKCDLVFGGRWAKPPEGGPQISSTGYRCAFLTLADGLQALSDVREAPQTLQAGLWLIL